MVGIEKTRFAQMHAGIAKTGQYDVFRICGSTPRANKRSKPVGAEAGTVERKAICHKAHLSESFMGDPKHERCRALGQVLTRLIRT